MSHSVRIVLIGTTLLLSSRAVAAGTGTLTDPYDNVAELNSAIAAAADGAVVYLRAGVYADQIHLGGRGAPDNPVTVAVSDGTRETLGGARLTSGGARFTGSHQVLRGIHFDGGDQRVFFEAGAHHNRLTECLLDDIGDGNGVLDIGSTGNDSHHNEIDHNSILRPNRYALRVRIRSHRNEGNTHNHIHHNVFVDHQTGGNYETVQLGYGATSALMPAHTVIERNYFYDCDSDNEIMSLKSSNNVVLNNVIEESDGHITVRAGTSNDIIGNVVYLSGEESAYGIRVYGRDNRILNNYFEDRGGDAALRYFGVAIRSGEMPYLEGEIDDIAAQVLTDHDAGWSAGEHDGRFLWVQAGGGDPLQYGIVSTLTDPPRLTQDAYSFLDDNAAAGDAYTVAGSYMPAIDNLVAYNTFVGLQWQAIRIGSDESSLPDRTEYANNLVVTASDRDSYAAIEEYQAPSGQVFRSNLVHATGAMPVWASASGTPRPDGVVIADDPELTTAGLVQIPAADAAADGAGAAVDSVSTDLFGNPRHDHAPSVGAFEIGGTVPPDEHAGCSFDGCGDYAVPGRVAAPPPDGGDSGTDGGGSGTGDDSGAPDDSGTDGGGSGSGDASGPGGGPTGGGSTTAGDDGGCGCRMTSDRRAASLVQALLVAVLVRRRSRNEPWIRVESGR